MKLYHVQGEDKDDASNNLDWFVVAPTVEEAYELWRKAVRSFLGRLGTKKDYIRTRVILEDVSGTSYAGNARAISWDDLAIVHGDGADA